MQRGSCTGTDPSLFVFTLGSLSGAYCRFPSCSWRLCTWWNGGTHPSSSFQAERWGKTHLSVSLMFVNLQQLSSPADWPVSSWGMTRSCSVWYRLIILIQLRFENMRWLAFKRIRSVELKETSPRYSAAGEQLVERGSNGNLISSQLEPLPHNEIWKGILRALFIIFFEIAGFWHRKFNSSGAG